MRQPRHVSFPATSNANYFDSTGKTIYNCTQKYQVLSGNHNWAITVGVFFYPSRGSVLQCNSLLTALRDVPAGATRVWWFPGTGLRLSKRGILVKMLESWLECYFQGKWSPQTQIVYMWGSPIILRELYLSPLLCKSVCQQRKRIFLRQRKMPMLSLVHGASRRGK